MLDRIIEPLDAIARMSPDLALREARQLLAHATRESSLRQRVERTLAAAAVSAAGPSFETLVAADDWSLELFVWPRGATTPIHDHTSWGIYRCLAGNLGEDRFVRLDDESQHAVAHLRKDWRALWTPGQESSLLPYAGGIHRVRNAGLSAAASLHLYGPRGSIDGRDYEPGRDFVCDRPVLLAA